MLARSDKYRSFVVRQVQFIWKTVIPSGDSGARTHISVNTVSKNIQVYVLQNMTSCHNYVCSTADILR